MTLFKTCVLLLLFFSLLCAQQTKQVVVDPVSPITPSAITKDLADSDDSLLDSKEPKVFWKFFSQISKIPRPPRNLEKISNFVKNWAQENNFSFKQDKIGNILVQVPSSSPETSNAPKVCIQSHLDMVIEKNKGKVHDFTQDPLTLVVFKDPVTGEEWLKANGTTLGADNGVGVAASMAIAVEQAKRGPLELLFTVDEEIGLVGAMALEPGFVTAPILINLDIATPNMFCVGCAGNRRMQGMFDIEYFEDDDKKAYSIFEIKVSGLQGGHSGQDIHLGRASSVKIIGRALYKILKMVELSTSNLFLYSVDGGSSINAIPREASAVIALYPKDEKLEAKLEGVIADMEQELQRELKGIDDGVQLKCNRKASDSKEFPKRFFSMEFTARIIRTLNALPHGFQSFEPDFPRVTQSSTCLSAVETSRSRDQVIISTSQRGSVDSSRDYLSNAVAGVIELGQGKTKEINSYPGWTPNLKAPLLIRAQKVFQDLFHSEATALPVHAGIETGVIGSKQPSLQMIAFGCEIEFLHTPEEKVKISSVDRMYTLLKALLQSIAESPL